MSTLDYTGVSSVNGEGKPITDANGTVTGIKLKAIPGADGTKRPVTVTISADSVIIVNVAGVNNSFPVYSSLVVPFTVGAPSTLTYINPPTSTKACSTADGDVADAGEEFLDVAVGS